jgi:hypothetical protein
MVDHAIPVIYSTQTSPYMDIGPIEPFHAVEQIRDEE